MCPVCQTPRALYFRKYCEKFQMLPTIEFFMGVLAGGIFGYLVAIMVNSGSEVAGVRGAAEHDTRLSGTSTAQAGRLRWRVC
jgi:hypothetical protein